MGNTVDADAAKLAGLQIDLLQKIRSGQVSVDHLEWFNKLTREERDRFYADTIKPRVIAIDRTKSFDPAKFLDQPFGIEEQDERALGLHAVDLASVQLVNMFNHNETLLKGDERLRRLKKLGYIRLDARVLETLWENQSLIPVSWQGRASGSTIFIHFDGTILRFPGGGRVVPYLCHHHGNWYRDRAWLDYDCLSSHKSAVIVSI